MAGEDQGDLGTTCQSLRALTRRLYGVPFSNPEHPW